ncbi:MAG: DUF2807 domain-containing protein [Cyclobacteriaceae bacterium]|nr:MAG: DUF2807 domain-containing protein [Cyclobacteriaceae bacterium]
MQLLQKRLAITIFTILIFQAALAQKVTRNVGPFDGVNLGMPASMYVTQSNTSSVVIEAPGEVLDHIQTSVTNGVLVIKQDDDWKWWKNRNSKHVKIYITNPTFEQVSVSGSGNITGENTLQSRSLYIGVSGSGKVDLEIKTVDLDSKISGSGNMNLGGSARNTTLEISGSGNLDAENLASENCQVRISGSGNCRVQVDKSLESRVSGSGNVYYRGNPEKLSNHSSGSGSIKKIG